MPKASAFESSLAARIAVAAALALATLAAYSNAWRTPFVHDDVPSIVDNTSIRSLGDPAAIFRAQADGGITVAGRPMLNFSFALNRAVSGDAPWSYHALNLLIHLGSGLLLFAIILRTLAKRARHSSPTLVSFTIATIWLLHPLQTESVTYVVQRAESLMGFFFLLTLYSFIRGLETPRPTGWWTLLVAAAFAGVATKEVMVAAPLIVLLYDRALVSGSFREAWRQRRAVYLALASSWILLAALIVTNAQRGGTAGFGTSVSSWDYALTQGWAVCRYLWLALWPRNLVFDYGTPLVSLSDAWPYLVLVSAAVIATAVALWRNRPAGFLGASFFIILAPSSSVVPIATQTVAEHRMYLPLAAVVTAAVLAMDAMLGRRALAWLLVAAAALGARTQTRNETYRSDAALWADTVAKVPHNPRAQNNHGRNLLLAGDPAAATRHFARAIALKPDYAKAHNNLGVAWVELGRFEDAVAEHRAAVQLNPREGEFHHNLGTALLRLGRIEEAENAFAAARRLTPDFAAAEDNDLGRVYLERGEIARAMRLFQSALAARPDFPEAEGNLANALVETGATEAAVSHYRAALQLRPDDATLHFNLGNALATLRQFPAAKQQYRDALQRRPAFAEAHNNLGSVLQQEGDLAGAADEYRAALRANPNYSAARENLARLPAPK